MKKPVVLVIADGLGVAPEGPGNAISLANTPFLDKL
jgi:2,3-bisphosphoglycerate-independent phosphoglycerate mutase